MVLTAEDGRGYSVTVPALPGCVSQAETSDRALRMIREAIETYLESLEARAVPIRGPIEIERSHSQPNPNVAATGDDAAPAGGWWASADGSSSGSGEATRSSAARASAARARPNARE